MMKDPAKSKNNAAGETDLDEVREQMRARMGFNDEATNITLMAVDELAEQAAEMEKVQLELEKTQHELKTIRAELEQARAEREPQPEPAAEREASASADAELAESRRLLDEMQAELKETHNRLLRTAADFENYRRRTQRALGDATQNARAEAAAPFLDVLDDLRRTLDAAQQARQQRDTGNALKSLLDGLEMVYNKFLDEFARMGIEPIEAVGQPFNEQEHDALMQQPAPQGTASGTILHEIKKGYKLGDRVLRHAQVVVAQ